MGAIMKVAIIFIGTSRYINFLPLYYEKCEENFLVNTDKTYFVFTDGELSNTPGNVLPYHLDHLDWPYITLNRFQIINTIKEDLKNFDCIVFMDADTLVIDSITEDEFFSDKPLFGVHHPCSYLKMPPHDRPPGAFESDPRSRAYVDTENFTTYFQGCLWGGKTPEIFELIDQLEENIKQDLNDGIIAVWHDESHLNHYFTKHPDLVHVLGPEYAYPEIFSQYCGFEPKIVHLAKDNDKYQQ
jgi:hypothetical protein